MLKNVELAAHFRLPHFPPSYLVLTLFIANIILSCMSANMMLFLLFAFVYGSLMLYRLRTTHVYLKIIVLLNLLVFWAFANGVAISRYE